MPKLGMEPVRRKALIDAAILAIGERGSLDVTMSEIAGRAGVSPALAHHYFGAKDELLQATMRHILSELGADLRAALASAATPRERLDAILAVNFSDSQFRAETIAAWLAFYVEAQRSTAMRRLLRIYARRLHSNLMSGLSPLLPERRGLPRGGGRGRTDRRALHPPRSQGRAARSCLGRRAGARLSRPETRTQRRARMSARPNILILMVDQLNGTLFPDGPVDFLHTPHLAELASRSVRFANNYTASPLCAPGRASFMSGQLPSRTRVYDNAAEFVSAIPTYAHHLRMAGYFTCLSGKMHFVGPDQLHGLEERLTTDIYPADFGWTPDYRKPGERIDWWYHNLGSVTGAGVAEISNQMEYDDEVAFNAEQKLYQLARQSQDEERRPWCLTVSFTHPHDPYVARRKYWDLYEDCPALEPKIGAIPFEEQDAHSQRLYLANDYKNFDIEPENVRRARRGYFANISYLDDKVGSILDVLKRTRMDDDTIVVFCSDHGDMLGERGLWFKMSFFEGSARVPLMIAAPGVKGRLVETPVSNLDILPTLCDLAGVEMHGIMPWTDGQSLKPLMNGGAAQRTRAYGICRRRLLRADGRDTPGQVEIRPLRARPAAALRPGEAIRSSRPTSRPIRLMPMCCRSSRK